MYIVSVRVDKSDIDGKGVFAAEDIRKGTIVWVFKDGHDFKMKPQEFEKLETSTKTMIKDTGYLSPSSGLYVFPPKDDPACFTNHSQNNNLSTVFDESVSDEPYFISNRDISKGEELTNNYLEFDKITQHLKPSWA
jgi:SET domain-containing protein